MLVAEDIWRAAALPDPPGLMVIKTVVVDVQVTPRFAVASSGVGVRSEYIPKASVAGAMVHEAGPGGAAWAGKISAQKAAIAPTATTQIRPMLTLSITLS
jgi:hypothetical protein